jgi:uncharacterized membrane protein YkoI
MNARRKQWLRSLLTALLFAAGAWAVYADVLDHEDARRAVLRGELRPLSEILDSIAREFGGQVLKVELERKDSGALVYEIEILGRDGRVLELEYDGRTGKRMETDDDDDRQR